MNLSLRLYPSKKDLDLKLHTPDNETECPILQETIQTAVFETFPRPYDIAHPEQKALTLACSHTFHAMALVYNWSRNQNVLCPICRAGPRGQRLVMCRLPDDWRYSLASKVRRERRRDRLEMEHEHFRMAAQISQETNLNAVVSFFIKIEIEGLTRGHVPFTWRLGTVFSPTHDTVVFEVPDNDLRGIPFTPGSLIRLIPLAYANRSINMLAPSEWFVMGNCLTESRGFSIEYNDTGGFKNMRLTLHEDDFSSLIVNAYFETQ